MVVLRTNLERPQRGHSDTLTGMVRKNKDGKWTTFFVAKASSDGKVDMREIDPSDPALASDPELAGEGVGQLRLENDDQVWVVITLDEAAHEHAQRAFRDAAALAQEHMIPHQPYRPDGEG
jgi:hypothetical protein